VVRSTAPLQVWTPAAEVRYPDPVLSANIYCSGRLCEVLHRLVKPFWDAWRGSDPQRTTYLWVMRYARCGEHLKVRLHAFESHATLLRELLESAQRQYFSSLGPPDPGAPSRSTRTAPPIDTEDGAPFDYPDRTFLWTRYNRNPLSLGSQPLMGDDQYTARITRCLGCGTEILLARLETDTNGRCPFALQSSLFMQGLMAGLSALPFSPSERNLYLLYHRDCLLRYLRRRNTSPDGTSIVAKTMSRFETELAKRNGRKGGLTRVALEALEAADTETWSGDVSAWRAALEDLFEYASPLCFSLQLDPFAERPVFPVLFKVFQGFANQIGLDQLNEAFLCHLLLAITADEQLRRRQVPLRPLA
jgi:hypothetical protein